jgi:hypothetical protein
MSKLKEIMIIFDLAVLVISAWLVVIPIIFILGLLIKLISFVQDVLIEYLKLVKKEGQRR